MSKYICECGIELPENKCGRKNHRKSKTHNLRLKYSHFIYNDKFMCYSCNKNIEILECEDHLESTLHKSNLKHTITYTFDDYNIKFTSYKDMIF